jgi:phosphohistidine swiveling domain-containing protein
VVLHLFEKEFAPRLRNAAGIIALDDDDAGELEAQGTAYSIPVLVEVRDADTSWKRAPRCSSTPRTTGGGAVVSAN